MPSASILLTSVKVGDCLSMCEKGLPTVDSSSSDDNFGNGTEGGRSELNRIFLYSYDTMCLDSYDYTFLDPRRNRSNI